MHGNATRRLKTMTTAAESEVLRQVRLAEVINWELSEAPGTRRITSLKSDYSRQVMERIHFRNKLYCHNMNRIMFLFYFVYLIHSHARIVFSPRPIKRNHPRVIFPLKQIGTPSGTWFSSHLHCLWSSDSSSPLSSNQHSMLHMVIFYVELVLV